MRRRQFLTGAEARPRRRQHTRPCSDCPWARASVAGWLGAASVDEWLDSVHGEALIDCHTVSNQQCAGAAIFRGNVCKLPRDPQILRLPPDRHLVFGRDAEFRKHHEGGLFHARTERVP